MFVFGKIATLLARAKVPAPITAAIALGRLAAFRKPSGDAREVVVGDLLRGLVARTLAQQVSQQLDAACHPYQNGPAWDLQHSRRSGTMRGR